MRVALVIERFETQGGVEGVAWQVAHGLAAAGDEVHVVARKAAACDGIHVHLVRVPSLWQPWRVMAFSEAASRVAPRGTFDVVHSFSRTRHQDLYRAHWERAVPYEVHVSGGKETQIARWRSHEAAVTTGSRPPTIRSGSRLASRVRSAISVRSQPTTKNRPPHSQGRGTS